MATAYDTANIIIPQGGGYKAGSLYGWNPQDSSLVDFSVTRAGATATRVNSAGLIESVAANVPRWDWAEGLSCPSLLVEPQSTNLEDNSEAITAANYFDLNVTFNNNATTAPDGTTTADQVTAGGGSQSQLSNAYSVSASTDYVFSFFGKQQSGATDLNSFRVIDNVGILAILTINWSTGVITQTTGSGAYSEQYADGWYRIVIPVTTNSGASTATPQMVGFATYGAGESAYFWGAQFEEGSYATSYIPTAGSTETRNADVIQKTSIASLLGQGEGSLYLEASWFEQGLIGVSDGSTANRAAIGRAAATGRFLIFSGGVSQADINGIAINTDGTYYKLAGRYKTNDISFYIDGNLVGTDTSASTFSGTTLSQVNFNGGGVNFFYGRIRTLSVYDYALDNTELANITT